MQSIKDNLGEMDCVMIQQMLQARSNRNTDETVKYATQAVDSRMQVWQAKREEE